MAETLPPLMWYAVSEWTRRYQAEEFSLLAQVRPLYEQLFPSFKEELQRFFLRNFMVQVKGRQVFDPTTAKRVGLMDWMDNLDEMLLAVEEEAVDAMDESLADGHDEGYALGLWMLRLNGVEVEERSIPRDALPYLAAGAIAGLTWGERAKGHRLLAGMKFREALRGAAVRGEGFESLAAPLDTVFGRYRHGLDALASNELYLSRMQGMTRAMTPYAADIPMIWVTKDDEMVCKFQTAPRRACAPLHLVQTDYVPGIDSHPGCRCALVPYARGYVGHVIPFETFRTTLT